MARIKINGRGAVYHCISRIVGEERLLGELEKEKLRHLLWHQAAFSGIEILTYCLMSNHIHLLVRVPAPVTPSDPELVERAVAFYGTTSPYVHTLREALAQSGHLPEDLRAGLLSRMGDVSAFMKELKQRFSRWFNRMHHRFGTLWAERFKSLVVEELRERGVRGIPGAVWGAAADGGAAAAWGGGVGALDDAAGPAGGRGGIGEEPTGPGSQRTNPSFTSPTLRDRPRPGGRIVPMGSRRGPRTGSGKDPSGELRRMMNR